MCCGYSFELHRQVDAIQVGTHNKYLYKEIDKKYTGCNMKTPELLDCAFIGVCAVIRPNTVYKQFIHAKFLHFASISTQNVEFLQFILASTQMYRR